MSFLKMIQRAVFHILSIIVLFLIFNFLVYPKTLLMETIGEHQGQIIFSSVIFIIFMIMQYARISKDNDLHREITALINKSEKEYSLRNTFFEYMKQYGITEIISFMVAIFMFILLYVNINTRIDNVMNDVFIHINNLLKFIYSNDARLGSFNIYIILNFILVSILYAIAFSVIMCHIITKCEENRLHKDIKK